MKKAMLLMAALALVVGTAASTSARTIRNTTDSSFAGIRDVRLVDNFVGIYNDTTQNTTTTSSANSGGNVTISDDDQEMTTVTTGNAAAATQTSDDVNASGIDEAVEDAASTDSIDMTDDESEARIVVENTVDTDADVEQYADDDTFTDAAGNTGDNAVVSGDSLTTTNVSTGASNGATSRTYFANTFVKVLRVLR